MRLLLKAGADLAQRPGFEFKRFNIDRGLETGSAGILLSTYINTKIDK